MKKYVSLLMILMSFSCEDVVDIELPPEEPRLIVDALIRIDPDLLVMRFGIQVYKSSGFYERVPATNLKQITIANLVLQDTANPGSGLYENYLSPQGMNKDEVVLQVNHEGQRYLARAVYQNSARIKSLGQGPGNEFNNHTELIVSFEDDPDVENFYLFDFGFNNFMVTSDKFYNGQTYEFSYKFNQQIASGTPLKVSIMGIDRSFFNYMNIVINQSKEQSVLFETPVSTLRGNIINVTDIDNIDTFDNVNDTNNFALGYFALAETYSQSIVIE